jgi:hypothetical protein
MKNILNLKDKHEVLSRISNLELSFQPIWGQMNVNEMVCHIADQLRLALGIKVADPVGNFRKEKILKWLILWGMPTPKGKVQTVKELKQGAGGTKPTSFDCDVKLLINLIEDFDVSFKTNSRKHPAFGSLTKNQWGRLAYIHLDHHLKQFEQ